MINETTQSSSLLKTIWGLKGNILWAFLMYSVCSVAYKVKDLDEDKNFRFIYYFKVRYYSPFFWIYVILALFVAFVVGGYPEFYQCYRDNFSCNDEEGTVYTLTGKFTDIHMKTFYPIRKFLDFVLVYGSA